MLWQIIEADGSSTYELNGETVTVEQALAWMENDPASQAHLNRQNAQADAQQLLNAATVAIREWAMDTQAWLYTKGASGTFDQAAFLALVQQAETAGLAFNALDPDDLTASLIQEQAGMALRGQQAQILYALSQAADGT